MEVVACFQAERHVYCKEYSHNGYLAQAPWFGVINEDKLAAATTVYSTLRAIDSLKVLLAPCVPFSAERVHRALGYEYPLFGAQHIVTYAERERTHAALVYDATQARGHWAPSALTPGRRLELLKPLYKKLEETAVGVELHTEMDYDANASRAGYE